MAAAGAPGGGDGGLNAEQILRLFQRMKEEDRRDSLPKNIAALIQKFQPRFAQNVGVVDYHAIGWELFEEAVPLMQQLFKVISSLAGLARG